jgi:crotonobetainyl-CoA:carnitine CoA-transferase CaiB-like acyl-CoA transferase
MGENADRLAYGDDAAAAGGLVRWGPKGAPKFIGDALADPLTGFAAAAAGLEAMRQGGGFLVDAALARAAASAAGRAERPAA